ncbi:MAG TPA: S8 family peptidase [Mycobacteriales bacterium]|nr:S8 family peptidase [Mycobacteriales bacterium]
MWDGTRKRAARLALAVALSVPVVPGLLGLHPATAGYPEACYFGVGGAEQRGLIAAPAHADRELLAAVRRSGGQAGRRVAPMGLRQVLWPSQGGRDAGLAALAGVPGVSFVEPVQRVAAHRTSNDPALRRQWGLAKIGAPRAWDVTTGVGSTVVVAVLDTGVDLRHPDLRGRVINGPNVAYGTDDSQDDQSHGTHVAGIAAATTNNRVGVAGLSWGATVLAVKVLNAQGSGTSCDIAVGIIEAADRGADVINLSLGGAFTCPLAFRAAVAYAEQKGALVVASSGNDGFFASPQSAPANCPGVLGVGATDIRDEPSAFTTFGASVDVAAPGTEILSTFYDPKKRASTYATQSGTSMSAPFVSGLAALLKAKHPTWTPSQLASRIVETADDLGPPGRDDFYGAGRINAARALAG